ncbi:hypothetical protein [Nonomuraea endophytica]|uniref:hypothetical protein n=1 Tax=Nonomuraea endophytica TaxID=714136 RepID=UPI0037C7AD06
MKTGPVAKLTLAVAVALTALPAVAAEATSASPPYYLYYRNTANLCKVSPPHIPSKDIPRHSYGGSSIRTWTVGNYKYTLARQTGFVKARVERVCSKTIQEIYYGIEAGKVSRLTKRTQLCYAGGCNAGGMSYGSWRKGWTHETW